MASTKLDLQENQLSENVIKSVGVCILNEIRGLNVKAIVGLPAQKAVFL